MLSNDSNNIYIQIFKEKPLRSFELRRLNNKSTYSWLFEIIYLGWKFKSCLGGHFYK